MGTAWPANLVSTAMNWKLPVWQSESTDPEHPLFDAPPSYVGELKGPEGHNFKSRIAPEIAAEIRRMNAIRGMNKSHIAKKLGISRATVIKYCGIN